MGKNSTWIHLDFTWTEGVSKNILGLERSGKVRKGSEKWRKTLQKLTKATKKVLSPGTPGKMVL